MNEELGIFTPPPRERFEVLGCGGGIPNSSLLIPNFQLKWGFT